MRMLAAEPNGTTSSVASSPHASCRAPGRHVSPQVHTYLLNLLQPLLQRAHGVPLPLELLQPGDELSSEGRRLHGGHLLRQAVCPLQGGQQNREGHG